MEVRPRDPRPRSGSCRLRGLRRAALGLALGGALAIAAADAPAEFAPLYQWVDGEGVVRYTPDPDRVPRSRRATMVLVRPGTPAPAPTASAGSEPAPLPTGLPPAATSTPERSPEGASDQAGQGADPFNAPGRARRVVSERIEEPAPRGGSAPTALDAQIRELEAAIARDQEALMALIGEASPEGADPADDSDELREIARRLPALQADLRALRERRAQLEER
jgi:hypothetical protein